ncbi:hypothetical protein BM221_005596 [Beauveria bassiana]|uniref:Uncharacterized protein n=1 Tax=Beauveria bassiana TaxID=176275 RepID=A0A2N6NP22_BEABA|nr:hypothetical protein BM221_005596 [Beauveria bassiana]
MARMMTVKDLRDLRACTEAACAAPLLAEEASGPGINSLSSSSFSSRILGAGPPPTGISVVVGLTDGGVMDDWRRMRLRKRPLEARGPAMLYLILDT